MVDETSKRVRKLTSQYEKLATTGGGWEMLYRAPDGKLWEKTYPQSHLHGGGPPALRVITKAEAHEKYGAVVPETSTPV